MISLKDQLKYLNFTHNHKILIIYCYLSLKCLHKLYIRKKANKIKCFVKLRVTKTNFSFLLTDIFF